MNKEQRRAVVECLMDASDNRSPPLFELQIDGEYPKRVVSEAIRLKDRVGDGSSVEEDEDDYEEFSLAYTTDALEAAYRLIERDSKLRAEWFAKPDIGALVAEIAHAPPPPDWQAKVNAECDKLDEHTRHDVAASVARHSVLCVGSGTDDDPLTTFTTQFKAAHADDEPTQVATVVDERFDGSEVEK